MTLSLAHSCGFLAVSGALSHLLYFRKGEHIKASPVYVVCALIAPAAIFLVLLFAYETTIWHSCRVTAAVYWSLLGGLFISMALYRALFHPLSQYPGPFIARITQFWLPVQVAGRINSAWFIDALHQKHGEYFRLGPNLLSVADPDMVEVIHAPGTKFGKGQWYDLAKPLTSLMNIREKHIHDKRKRDAWDPAFSPKALRNYDPRILRHADRLVQHLAQTAGQNVNITEWVNFFSFDVMGDLTFGRHFDHLETGKPHLYMKHVHENGKAFGQLHTCTWLLHALTRLVPEDMMAMNIMLKYSRQSIERRKANEPAVPDIMSTLLKADKFFKSEKDETLLLEADVRLLMIAGSDTTATTLAFLFYHLAQAPSIVKQLRQELVDHGVGNDTFDIPKLNNLLYMNACINECLRLHPPVPGGVHRSSPEEGIEVNGHYIPGGIQVLTPMYTIQRSPRAFVHPDEFIPERWTTRPELILNKQAWFPFSLNSWGCIGKQLAYNELRTVTAKIVLDFDVTFAPGETGCDIMNKSQDIFTTTCAPLYLIFTAARDT